MVETSDASRPAGSRRSSLLPTVMSVIALLACAGLFKKTQELSRDLDRHTYSSSIAFIDMDKVAGTIGMLEQIEGEMTATNNRLRRAREEARQNLQQQVTEAEAQLNQESTEENQQQLQRILQEARARLQQVDQEVTRLSQQNEAKMVQAARAEILPFAKEVAEALGAQAVVELEPTVFWHDEGWDITEEVIKRIQAAQRKAAGEDPLE